MSKKDCPRPAVELAYFCSLFHSLCEFSWSCSCLAEMSDIDLKVMDMEGEPAGDPVPPEEAQTDPVPPAEEAQTDSGPPAEDSPPSPDDLPSSGAGSPEPLLPAKEENGVTPSGEAGELPEKEPVVTTTVIVNVGIDEPEKRPKEEIFVQKEYVILIMYY